MRYKLFFLFFTLAIVLFTASYLFVRTPSPKNEDFISYKVDLQSQDLRFYWKNEKGEIFKNAGTLKAWLNHKGKDLLFAMNAGMFTKDNAPLGLFCCKLPELGIRDGSETCDLFDASRYGNKEPN